MLGVTPGEGTGKKSQGREKFTPQTFSSVSSLVTLTLSPLREGLKDIFQTGGLLSPVEKRLFHMGMGILFHPITD